MARKSSNRLSSEDVDDLLDELCIPVFTQAEIAPVSEAAELGHDEFQKASATLYQKMLVEGFKTISAPKNLKELATVQKLYREAAGLDKKDQGVVPQGFVPNMRNVSRRTIEPAPPVIDATPDPVDLDDFEV